MKHIKPSEAHKAIYPLSACPNVLCIADYINCKFEILNVSRFLKLKNFLKNQFQQLNVKFWLQPLITIIQFGCSFFRTIWLGNHPWALLTKAEALFKLSSRECNSWDNKTLQDTKWFNYLKKTVPSRSENVMREWNNKY